LLLRGSSLKNTPYVYGICIFSGHETKVMKNSANAKYKFSSLEIHMNKAMVQILCLQVFLALIAAFIGANWIVNNTSNTWDSQVCHSTSDLVGSGC